MCECEVSMCQCVRLAHAPTLRVSVNVCELPLGRVRCVVGAIGGVCVCVLVCVQGPCTHPVLLNVCLARGREGSEERRWAQSEVHARACR